MSGTQDSIVVTASPSLNTSPVKLQLENLLSERILILDGAMGTMIQGYQLTEDDYRGDRFAEHPSDLKGNNDLLSLTQPNIIQEIHQAYLDAGADIIETNTFNSNAISQADYKLETIVYELNKQGAALAKAVTSAQTEKTPEKPRFVAGVLGPTSRTCSLSPDVNDPSYRNVDFDTLVDDYSEATRGLIDGGAILFSLKPYSIPSTLEPLFMRYNAILRKPGSNYR